MGEHGVGWENMENTEKMEKDGKHQPDNLKHSLYYSKHSICDSKNSICQQDDLENLILGQLKMGEH